MAQILSEKADCKPERPVETFRIYEKEPTDIIQERVRNTYFNQHQYQTVEFAKEKNAKWLQFNKAEMTIMEALHILNEYVDPSDPDVDVPNIVHAFQTAERIREKYPNEDWFQLVGLVHDLGKVLGMWGEPGWAVTGDTYPVGCKPADSIVYGAESFRGNPDMEDAKYNTALGMYERGCGLDSLLMTWGHDEYMYQVIKHHIATVKPKHVLPEVGLKMIRFHSFYPWHTGGDYQQFCDENDKKFHEWIMEFNKFDLYSKADNPPDVGALTSYYQQLIDKYLPGKVKF